jgi:hypothetical protein
VVLFAGAHIGLPQPSSTTLAIALAYPSYDRLVRDGERSKAALAELAEYVGRISPVSRHTSPPQPWAE